MKRFSVGQKATYTKTFTPEDVKQFSEVSGDDNPIHLDPEYAATTPFKKNIVHGALTSSLFSTILGTIFPGEGTIYISQCTKFIKPVYVNDTITAEVEVTKIEGSKKILVLATRCYNQNNELVADGEAKVKLPFAEAIPDAEPVKVNKTQWVGIENIMKFNKMSMDVFKAWNNMAWNNVSNNMKTFYESWMTIKN
ncbi:MAG: MaoC family dehydratase [Bacteroidia bacterium]|nr:MaoC family dehydratase [Bacteroidia bacterium]